MSPEAVKRAAFNLAWDVASMDSRGFHPGQESLTRLRRVIEWETATDESTIAFAHKIVEAGR